MCEAGSVRLLCNKQCQNSMACSTTDTTSSVKTLWLVLQQTQQRLYMSKVCRLCSTTYKIHMYNRYLYRILGGLKLRNLGINSATPHPINLHDHQVAVLHHSYIAKVAGNKQLPFRGNIFYTFLRTVIFSIFLSQAIRSQQCRLQRFR